VTGSVIHPTAVVSDTAVLGGDCVVGPFAVIDAGVQLGRGVEISSHAVLRTGVTIGDRVKVGSHSVIGGDPQDLSFDGSPSEVVVGAGTVIHEAVTIHRATGRTPTVIGPGCLIMGQVHVAHDCDVAAAVVVAQGAKLAGHVRLGERSVVGGMAGIHQWVRVGQHAMVGAMAKVVRDVLPFTVADGNPARHLQINAARLRRRGFPQQEIRALRAALHSVRTGGEVDRHDAGRAVSAFADFVDGPSRRGVSAFA
jgi:UDP-N-acetylglucosamine acyltransferase